MVMDGWQKEMSQVPGGGQQAPKELRVLCSASVHRRAGMHRPTSDGYSIMGNDGSNLDCPGLLACDGALKP